MPSNILLIEDYLADAILMQKYLNQTPFKYNIHWTDELYNGLEIIKNSKVHLTILDLSVKDCAGFTSLIVYLEQARHVPVIVNTGLKNNVMKIQCIKAGAQDFLIKGEFDMKDISKSVQTTLARFGSF